MRPHSCFLLGILVVLQGHLWSQTPASKGPDPLDRTDPRSAVTAFLESCHDDNYVRAAQYLDLRQISASRRAERGPQLARALETILNSDSRFNALRLSQASEGNLADDPDQSLEQVTNIERNNRTYPIKLQFVETQPGTSVWLFSAPTVALIPSLVQPTTKSAIEARLPRFLVSIQMLETPLWKWIALLAVALAVLFLFHTVARLMLRFGGKWMAGPLAASRWLWIRALVQPWLVFLSALSFGVAEQFIDPSALSRLYVGRGILFVIVWAFAWCLINLVDLFLTRLDTMLDPRQRVVSHSLIHMGRRAVKVGILVVAAIVVLDNWGYNMTTMVAGLGVGGIAVALAAQATIANVFGGVSIIGDRPVLIGDYGNFGGVLGTVEDIGMRSTRVRTLNRTLMSIPNSNFAGMNLENYASRDKILFNPTLQVKRSVPQDKIRQLMKALEEMLKADKRLEVGPAPIRLADLTAAAFAMEIFAYVKTADIDEFYKVEADLFLEIDGALASNGVELA